MGQAEKATPLYRADTIEATDISTTTISGNTVYSSSGLTEAAQLFQSGSTVHISGGLILAVTGP